MAISPRNVAVSEGGEPSSEHIAVGEMDTEQMENDLLMGHEGLDLSRTPPRIMMKEALPRAALRDELKGIFAEDSLGIPTGKLIRLSDLPGRPPLLLKPTAITKLKSNKGYKCRLCIRGDQQPEAVADFTSAPTTAREYVRIAVLLFVNDPLYRFLTVDISRAFTQSDYYNKSDRVWIEHPKYVCPAFPVWREELFLDSHCLVVEDASGAHTVRAKRDTTRYGVRLLNPLYGTRDALMRWYCKLAGILTARSFFFLKADRCVFSRYRDLEKNEEGHTPGATRIITCIVVIHVDDIIFSGIHSDYTDLRRALSELKHGEWEELKVGEEIIFFGIVLGLKEGRVIDMTQQPYYSKIKPLVKTEFIEKNQLRILEREAHRRLNAFVGACLWLSQTRFDIGFSLSLLGSSIPPATKSIKELTFFLKTAGKLLGRINQQHVPYGICLGVMGKVFRAKQSVDSHRYFASVMLRTVHYQTEDR